MSLNAALKGVLMVVSVSANEPASSSELNRGFSFTGLAPLLLREEDENEGDRPRDGAFSVDVTNERALLSSTFPRRPSLDLFKDKTSLDRNSTSIRLKSLARAILRTKDSAVLSLEFSWSNSSSRPKVFTRRDCQAGWENVGLVIHGRPPHHCLGGALARSGPATSC